MTTHAGFRYMTKQKRKENTEVSKREEKGKKKKKSSTGLIQVAIQVFLCFTWSQGMNGPMFVCKNKLKEEKEFHKRHFSKENPKNHKSHERTQQHKTHTPLRPSPL